MSREENTRVQSIGTEVKNAISQLRAAIGDKKVCLFYPVYVNTYILAHILESSDVLNKNKDRIERFNWSDILPKKLKEVLLERGNEFDLIYCFSSSDKETTFRQAVQEIINSYNLGYKISVPEDTTNTFPSSISMDIDYSNFSLKYLFFQNKINIQEIHTLGKEFYSFNGSVDPYLNKLLSVLLARGYQTIHIDTDIQDESKGLLRKLLHEEYGFKFRLTPNLLEYKANNTLVVETKGGQQSFEELKLQENGRNNNKPTSDKLTFIIQDNIKYTSKTKLIAIYKNSFKDGVQDDKPTIRTALKQLSDLIFDKEKNIHLIIDENICKDFTLNNIHFLIEETKHPDNSYSEAKFEQVKRSNPFLLSLELYEIAERHLKEVVEKSINHKMLETDEGELFKIISEQAQYLQIKTTADFINCLNDHHVPQPVNKLIKSNISESGEDKLYDFCRFVYKNYEGSFEKHKILRNGLFLLSLVIINPNGLFKDTDVDTDEKLSKCIEDCNEKRKKFEDEMDKEISEERNYTYLYNILRIVAEDLNFLIIDENLLGPPKILLKTFDWFDITEFEYLFSAELSKNERLFHNTKPVS